MCPNKNKLGSDLSCECLQQINDSINFYAWQILNNAYEDLKKII